MQKRPTEYYFLVIVKKGKESGLFLQQKNGIK